MKNFELSRCKPTKSDRFQYKNIQVIFKHTIVSDFPYLDPFIIPQQFNKDDHYCPFHPTASTLASCTLIMWFTAWGGQLGDKLRNLELEAPTFYM